ARRLCVVGRLGGPRGRSACPSNRLTLPRAMRAPLPINLTALSAAERCRDRIERGLRLGAVRAAGLSQVGTAAAAFAAERFGAAAHQVNGIEAPHQIRRDTHHEACLAVTGDTHDGDDAGPDLLL